MAIKNDWEEYLKIIIDFYKKAKVLDEEKLKINYEKDEDTFIETFKTLISDFIKEFFNSDKEALEFLSDYDYNLSTALRYAKEAGYRIYELNSELLATLYFKHNLLEELESSVDYYAEYFFEGEV